MQDELDRLDLDPAAEDGGGPGTGAPCLSAGADSVGA